MEEFFEKVHKEIKKQTEGPLVVQIKTVEDAKKYLLAEELPDNVYTEEFKKVLEEEDFHYSALAGLLIDVGNILKIPPMEVLKRVDLGYGGSRIRLVTGETIEHVHDYGEDCEFKGIIVYDKDGKKLGERGVHIGPGGH